MTQNSGPTASSRRTSIQNCRCSRAHSSTPTSRRRAPWPRRTSSAPRRRSSSDSLSISASWMCKPARQSTTISPATGVRGARRWRRASRRRSARRLADLLDSDLHCFAAGGRRRKPVIVAGDRRRPAASSNRSVMTSWVRRRAASLAKRRTGRGGRAGPRGAHKGRVVGVLLLRVGGAGRRSGRAVVAASLMSAVGGGSAWSRATPTSPRAPGTL
jgi:hypothetical protein